MAPTFLLRVDSSLVATFLGYSEKMGVGHSFVLFAEFRKKLVSSFEIGTRNDGIKGR